MKKLILILLFVPLVSFGQSLRSIDLDSYKYLVIDEVSGGKQGETRRFLVKNLEKAGYNVVNLQNPLKTYKNYPEDLNKNPNLALYIFFSMDAGFWGYEAELILYNSNNKEVLKRSGESGSLLSKAVKNTISSLINYNYKYRGQ